MPSRSYKYHAGTISSSSSTSPRETLLYPSSSRTSVRKHYADCN